MPWLVLFQFSPVQGDEGDVGEIRDGPVCRSTGRLDPDQMQLWVVGGWNFWI